MWGKRPDMIVHGEEPFNAEPPATAMADQDVTPVDTFYSRNHAAIPVIEPATWTLRVDGLVRRPATFSLAELAALLPEHTETATLQCAGNRRAGLVEVADIPGEAPWGAAATATGRWSGIRLADLLRHVGVRDGATDVAFLGADVPGESTPPEGFGGSIPLRKAQLGEVLLAWSMNDEPLTALHGSPLRVVVPGYIGARSVKWLERITVQDEPSRNFFQASTYRLYPADVDPLTQGPGDGVELGLVAVNSGVLSPADGTRVPAGPTRITGYAFAGGDRTIARVDVSSDGGATWIQAELGEQVSRWTWRHWHASVEVPRGDVEVIARAWDSSAALQPELAAQVWNPKGYVNNSWARTRLTGV